MAEPLSTDPYKGVRDFYPPEWAKMQAVFGTIRETLLRYGYEEYNASPLEPAELYESKTSEEIVNEQTFTFTDRGDRRVTLRPEMTPTLARMVAARRRELVFPLRWFNIGNRFRYERPQKGRLREFYQCDVDILGIPGPEAEGEAVVIAAELLRAFGATPADFSIRVSSRKLLDIACSALGLSSSEQAAYLGLLDRKNKMSASEFNEKREAFTRGGHDPLSLIESHEHADIEAEYAALASLMDAWKARGMDNVVFDPSIVRGFLYYTGLVFEVFDTNPDNPRALMGGGRYDRLVALFGGEPIPAMGFAFGDVTLMDFLSTHGLLPAASSAPELYLGTLSPEHIAAAQKLAQELRADGARVLVNVLDKGIGDQVREASRRGIPFFVAIGPDEAESESVRLKELVSGSEEIVAKSSLAEAVSQTPSLASSA